MPGFDITADVWVPAGVDIDEIDWNVGDLEDAIIEVDVQDGDRTAVLHDGVVVEAHPARLIFDELSFKDQQVPFHVPLPLYRAWLTTQLQMIEESNAADR